MLKTIKSNKGFTLVELMVVVAIIGILATVAIPSFKKQMLKAKQSEAKTLLSAYYSAQKAFHSEWNIYIGSFGDLGFAPEGRLNWHVSSGGAGSYTATQLGNIGYTFAGGLLTSGSAGAAFRTTTYCNHSSDPCELNIVTATSAANTNAHADANNPTATDFTAGAASDLNPSNPGTDRWTMDENRVLTNENSDFR